MLELSLWPYLFYIKLPARASSSQPLLKLSAPPQRRVIIEKSTWKSHNALLHTPPLALKRWSFLKQVAGPQSNYMLQ